VVGALSCSFAAWCFYRAYALRRDYPGLVDNSPNVDSYWPNVEELIFNVMGVGCSLFGVVVLAGVLVSLASAHRQNYISRLDDQA
jgi:hypothetical protein